LIDWLANRSRTSAHRQGLLDLDWRSPHEFFGYLVRVLEGDIPAESAPRGGDTDEERNWLRYVVALAADGDDGPKKAAGMLQSVVLTTGRENWLHYLALSRLQQIRQHNLAALEDAETRRQYQAQLDQFEQRLRESRRELAEHQRRLAPLQAQIGRESLAPERKRALLEKMLEADEDNGNILVELVFYCAMNAEWERALEFARRYLTLGGRENAGRLRIGLLTAEILAMTGRRSEVLAEMENYLSATRDAWYRLIAGALLDPQKQKSLEEQTGESPEYLLTGQVALALWAESAEDKNKAIEHYREALGSYMDDMIEYVFAVERIKNLRQK